MADSGVYANLEIRIFADTHP